jgi:hypothetical protein
MVCFASPLPDADSPTCGNTVTMGVAEEESNDAEKIAEEGIDALAAVKVMTADDGSMAEAQGQDVMDTLGRLTGRAMCLRDRKIRAGQEDQIPESIQRFLKMRGVLIEH